MNLQPNLVICGLVNIDYEINEQTSTIKAGGNASHIAKALKMLDLNIPKIGFYLKIGKNYLWKEMFEGFDQEGITYSEEECNQVTFVKKDINLEFLKYEQKCSNELYIFPQKYQNAQIIFIGAITSSHVDYIISKAKGIIAFNYSPWFNNVKLIELLPKIDIFIFNRGEALEMYQTDSIIDVFGKIKEYNSEIQLIITKDKDGCEYFNGSRYISVPTPEVESLNTLGGGAVFSTTYLYFLQNSNDILYSLSCASVTASLYISSDQDKLKDSDYFNNLCEFIMSKTQSYIV